MSDLTERLRQPVMLHSNAEQTNAERAEAADEIDLLREKVAVLEAELRVLYKMPAAINKAID